MTDTHDTIDGLLAEFRGYTFGMPESYRVTMSWADFRRMLDSLEAAWKRERELTKSPENVNSGAASDTAGDSAKLREALIKIRDLTEPCEGVTEVELIINDISKSALAAPPRNCDIYTTEDAVDTAGNCAKLREALVKCQGIALQWQADEIMGVAGSIEKPESRSASEALIDIEFVANAALAAPPRNCDVGTGGEQVKRFAEYCESEVCKRKRCKSRAKALCIERCALVWAQMPYEEQEGGAK